MSPGGEPEGSEAETIHNGTRELVAVESITSGICHSDPQILLWKLIVLKLLKEGGQFSEEYKLCQTTIRGGGA
jgi:hypothetical protein